MYYFRYFYQIQKKTLVLSASDYVEARIKYLSLYSLEETETDARLFEQKGRHIAKQVRLGMTAERKAAAATKRSEKEAIKVQKAVQLKAQRESKEQARKEKKQSSKKANNSQLIPQHWFTEDKSDDEKEDSEVASSNINLVNASNIMLEESSNDNPNVS